MSRLIAVAVALAAGCTSKDVDPIGSWSFTGTYTSGTCGLTGTNSGAITVAQGSSGYVLSSAVGIVNGTVTCTADSCSMTAMELLGTTVSISLNLTLLPSDGISGNGITNLTTPTICSQAFTVTGTKM